MSTDSGFYNLDHSIGSNPTQISYCLTHRLRESLSPASQEFKPNRKNTVESNIKRGFRQKRKNNQKMHLYWHYYSKGVHRPIKTYWHYYFYSINSPTLSFLGPHKKTSPAERLLLHPPNKRTQKNNIFQNKRSDLFFNFLFPHSLIIQGPRLSVSTHLSSSLPHPRQRPIAAIHARGADIPLPQTIHVSRSRTSQPPASHIRSTG